MGESTHFTTVPQNINFVSSVVPFDHIYGLVQILAPIDEHLRQKQKFAKTFYFGIF